MKQLFTLILLFSVTALTAQARPIKKFIRHHNDGAENISITVPGFLMGLASDIGISVADCEEDRAAFRLVQSLGTTRVLVFNSHDFDTRKNVNRLLSELESGYDFERWATVRTASGERIELTVQMRGKAVRELIAFVTTQDDGESVFIHAKTDFTAEELGQIINDLAD